VEYRILEKISEETISKKVEEIAQNIRADYKDKEPVFIGILNGCFIFMADLIRKISIPSEVDFVRLASYGSNSASSGSIRLTKDVELLIREKPVIIVEDIIDTGLTLSYLIKHIEKKAPESIKVCTLINKVERRNKEVVIDYRGFDLKEGFLVGYGLDYGENYRYLPYILSLKIED
jgi:hypoxanthine phosphoribosyltransferase